MERAVHAAMAAAVLATALAGTAASTMPVPGTAPAPGTARGASTLLAARTARGAAAWTAVKAPLPAGAASRSSAGFSDVACPSATTCVATGFYTDSAGNSRGLLLTGHGSSWTATRAPLPAGVVTSSATQPLVGSVACASPAACAAVGSYTDSAGNSRGLLLTGHGASWTASAVPLPAGAATSRSAVLTDVACPSATRCAATGYYTDSAGGQQGLLLTGHGSSWTAIQAPLPAGAGTSEDVGLTGVTCQSASMCVAVGSFGRNGLLLTGPGSAWRAAKAPLPAGVATNPFVSLSGVTCPATTTCVVVGQYEISDHNGRGLLLAGHGSSWTASTAPLPADADASPNSGLSEVSCRSAATCAAVGDYRATAAGHQGLLLAGRGTSWAAAKAPLPAGAPAGAASDIYDVSCPSATTCAAAGDYADSSGGSLGLLLTGHGASWTAIKLPVPAGAAPEPEASLSRVTCVATTTCVAVGSYTDAAGHGQAMLLTGPG